MSGRKPFEITWNSWIDRQIEESRKKGEFDNLSGRGQSLAQLASTYDENWWIKNKMQEEDYNLTPPTIKMRKKTEEWLAQFHKISHVDVMKFQAKQLNLEITEANQTSLGPMLPQSLLNIEQLCLDWKKKRST
jgi:hypothetical protein